IVSLLGSSTRTFTFSPREEYLRLAEEAYRWMMQFQITPPGTPWGWHLNCSEAWGGLAGYYTRKYRWAALYGAESFYQLYIASHDVGWFIELGVELYKITRKNEYLKAAELAAQWAMRIQVGYSKWLDEFKSFYIAPRKVGRSVSWRYIPGVNFPREAAGAYTEGMFVFSGKPPFMDDWGVGEEFAEPALWIAPEHVTPIAQGLLKLYEVTHNKTYLTSALRAIDFVIRMQSPEGGIYTSYPPYAYGIRMGDTADAALLLFYAYKVTGNKTYLERALLACDFMLSKQVARGKRKGALPHLSSAGGEWRVNSFFTGDAAATISAWLEAYEITGDEKYLNAAFNAGTFVISMQEVGNEPLWGARLYAYDKRAIGGFYWVYSPGYGYIAYQFIGTTTSAAIALLKLYTKTRFSLFLSHVKLALRWLRETEIYSPLGRELELPGLVVYSDPHGLYKSGYVPKYGKYYDEIPGTMSGDPEQGFCVAMAAAGPCYLYLELYRLYSEIEGG
ncbi:MAG: hypothetical protein DRJ52_04260, partial [Thermoprotei archaeon]